MHSFILACESGTRSESGAVERGRVSNCNGWQEIHKLLFLERYSRRSKTLPGTCWVNTRSVTLNIRGIEWIDSTDAPRRHVLGPGVPPFANLVALGVHSTAELREVDLEPSPIMPDGP